MQSVIQAVAIPSRPMPSPGLAAGNPVAGNPAVASAAGGLGKSTDTATACTAGRDPAANKNNESRQAGKVSDNSPTGRKTGQTGKTGRGKQSSSSETPFARIVAGLASHEQIDTPAKTPAGELVAVVAAASDKTPAIVGGKATVKATAATIVAAATGGKVANGTTAARAAVQAGRAAAVGKGHNAAKPAVVVAEAKTARSAVGRSKQASAPAGESVRVQLANQSARPATVQPGQVTAGEAAAGRAIAGKPASGAGQTTGNAHIGTGEIDGLAKAAQAAKAVKAGQAGHQTAGMTKAGTAANDAANDKGLAAAEKVDGKVDGKVAADGKSPAAGSSAAGSSSAGSGLIGQKVQAPAGQAAAVVASDQPSPTAAASGPSGPTSGASGPSGPAVMTAHAGGPETAPPSQAGSQVMTALRSSGLQDGAKVTIRLNPPELGRVNVTFQGEGKQLRAVFEVDNQQTLADLRRGTASLVSELANDGVQLRRVEFVFTGQTQTGSQPSGQNTGGPGWQLPDSQPWDRQAPDRQQGPVSDSDEELFDQAETHASQQAHPAGEIDGDTINVWI